MTRVRRLYGESFVVDEGIWHGEVIDGAPLLCDGKISRKNVWLDLAAIQKQLGQSAAPLKAAASF